MARGWESKSVEQQQDEVRSSSVSQHKLFSPEQIANESKRRGLELSRKHIGQQLEHATNAQYRQMLEAALKELDARLAEIH